MERDALLAPMVGSVCGNLLRYPGSLAPAGKLKMCEPHR